MNKTKNHIFYWLAVTALFVGIFGNILSSFSLSFYFVAMLLPVVMGTTYFFNYFLVPHYLLKKRYAKFCLYFAYLLIISTWLEMWVITGSFVLLTNFNYAHLGPLVTNIFLLAVILYFIVFFSSFLLLIKRFFTTEEKVQSLRVEKSKFLKGALTVKANRRQAKILFEEIYYIESMGDYINIITDSDESVTTHEPISHMNKKLPGNFMRIHRSYIVNGHKVNAFSKTELQINDTTLPISRTYKKQVTQKLSA